MLNERPIEQAWQPFDHVKDARENKSYGRYFEKLTEENAQVVLSTVTSDELYKTTLALEEYLINHSKDSGLVEVKQALAFINKLNDLKGAIEERTNV